ncbi:hypothetical protein ASPZODRAFT_12604 [Penicilliopsis zonata CBS 506.65]|uniref:LipA and NB-ARC domain protein n=1 Tax=Penicilliopsis zonata CBS 506.65 TaxID=1073090 RepID=A0A1L9SXC1_9EURO|nr:hypothetical protein ASPZODRAFT_12604 [Penicilliopsis zonata CBS 506.65]OJJ51799.1 hypothetical protein ASPZODRAFT_12604 [Penicilliopsis zonata CBS 506.65]
MSVKRKPLPSQALQVQTPQLLPEVPAGASPPPPPPPAQAQPPTLLDETRHFLGGLIHHPSTSTKHVSILRHSHGLVLYRGSSTSVAVSVFSDRPLPPTRTFWLQSKGWTGKTGMRAKTMLNLHSSWVEVTPSTAVRAEQILPRDERAWQRDIEQFQKTMKSQNARTHTLRETDVLRIPVEAGDGYFHLVLCSDGKRTLCTSPVFRLASASTSPSSLRGASLRTLPLELGVMAAGIYASSTLQTVVSPLTNTVQNMAPSWTEQTAATTAYSLSGAEERVDRMVGYEENTPAAKQIQMANAIRTRTSLRFIDDLGQDRRLNTNEIQIRLMGFLRPDGQLSATEAQEDAILAAQILTHPSWGPMVEEKGGWLDRTKERYTSARRQVDRIPLHRLGVRVRSDEMGDKEVRNGYYIVR